MSGSAAKPTVSTDPSNTVNSGPSSSQVNASELEEWYGRIQEGENGRVKATPDFTGVIKIFDEDNPLHFKEGLERALDQHVSWNQYRDFLDNAVKTLDPRGDAWQEERKEAGRLRPRNSFRSIGPGMAPATHFILDADRRIDEVEMSWNDPYFTGDAVRFTGENGSYVQEARTPHGDEWREKGSIEASYADGSPGENVYLANAANEVVARRDRAGDMILELLVEKEPGEELEGGELELAPSRENEEVEEEINGDIRKKIYGTPLVVDGRQVGSAQEVFIENDHYHGIEEDAHRERTALTPLTPLTVYMRAASTYFAD